MPARLEVLLTSTRSDNACYEGTNVYKLRQATPKAPMPDQNVSIPSSPHLTEPVHGALELLPELRSALASSHDVLQSPCDRLPCVGVPR